MNLCVDIGNTRVKIGVFQGKRLTKRIIATDFEESKILALANQIAATNAIVSSVAENVSNLIADLNGICPTFELTASTPLPFANRYATPETLGKDRLAAVAGAQALWSGKHCLVVDCGTCIKYDLMTSDGIYHGGNIAPGLKMRIQAMHHFTARLPEVAMEMPAGFIGDSTEKALQNGALRGAMLEIEGFVQLFEKKYAPLQVVFTGGDATFLQPFLTISNHLIEPDLTLHGLNHILNFQL